VERYLLQTEKEEKMATRKGTTTSYVVLRQGNDGFKIVGRADATSSHSAIKQLLTGSNAVEGHYVAVPERSFQVVPVAVKIPEPQLVIGQGAEQPDAAEETPASDIGRTARELREQIDEPLTAKH
jgi:hypothetical protein